MLSHVELDRLFIRCQVIFQSLCTSACQSFPKSLCAWIQTSCPCICMLVYACILSTCIFKNTLGCVYLRMFTYILHPEKCGQDMGRLPSAWS